MEEKTLISVYYRIAKSFLNFEIRDFESKLDILSPLLVDLFQGSNICLWQFSGTNHEEKFLWTNDPAWKEKISKTPKLINSFDQILSPKEPLFFFEKSPIDEEQHLFVRLCHNNEWLGVLEIRQNQNFRLESEDCNAFFAEASEIFGGILSQRAQKEKAFQIEEQFQTIVKFAPLSIIILDEKKTVKLWGGMAEKTFGWKPEETLGHLTPIIPEEKKEEFERLFQRVVQGKTLHGIEVERKRKDGTSCLVKVFSAALLKNDGSFAGVVSMIEDMSQTRNMEDRLIEAENRYLDLLETLPDIIWEVNERGEFTYLSPQIRELLGYLPEEWIGKEPPDMMSKKEAERIKKVWYPILESRQSFQLLLNSLKDKSGKEIHVESSGKPFYDTSGHFKGYRGVDRVVENRLQLEKELEEMNALLEQKVAERTKALRIIIKRYKTLQTRLEMVLWAANQGIWDWNLEKDEIYYDENWFKLLGYKKKEFADAGKVWRQLVHPDDIPNALKELENHIDGSKKFYEVEYRMKSKTEEWVWIYDKGRIIEYKDGVTPRRMVGIHADITKRRAFEEELKKAKEIAENANKSKSEFISNINHELRTPLTIIMGLSETLLMELPTDKKDFPKKILKHAHQLLNLISDVMDLAKIESGKFSLEKKPIFLPELLDTIRQSFALEVEKKGLKLVIEKAADLPETFIGDSLRIKQILINLIANSVKFTNKGSITLSCRSGFYQEEDKSIEFIVKDTGIGIPAEKLSKIFERFYQIDSSLHRKYPGTGLGLSIVKELVDLMSGKIWVESEEGKGTTFRVKIPIKNLETAILSNVTPD